jgi:hypothetical protein
MKTLLCLALGMSAVLSPLAVAVENEPEKEGRVSVVYAEPEKFTDFNSAGFGFATEKDLKYLTELFSEHLEKLAKRCLTPDQRLEITFKDIDLAGRFEPERGPGLQDVRIYRDITYPRMVFSFRLLDAAGQILAEGERKLTDLNYTMRLHLPMGSDEFSPDRELLTDWMSLEFKKKKN